MRVSPNEIKVCEKHNVVYTNLGNGNRRRCVECVREYNKLPHRLEKKREIDRNYQAKKRLENPDVLKQAQEKYKQTDKYRDWKISQLSITCSNIYCIRCNNNRVYNNDYCVDCNKLLHIINNHDYISVCKHCNKEYGLDVKISNSGKVFQLNKFCSVDCNKQSKINTQTLYKTTDTYKELKRERKRNGTHKKRVIKKGSKYQLIYRRILFQRFNYVCQGCNVKCVHPNDTNYNQDNCATIDHIKPISKGGDHTYVNTQLLCRKCNSIKRDNEKYFEHKQRAKQMELQFDLTMVKHGTGEQLALFEQGHGA
jgi:ribosomal protein S8